MASSKKGTSAKQLERMLWVSYKTAWFMGHRIREAMTENDGLPLGDDGDPVDVDEAYGEISANGVVALADGRTK